MKIENSGFKKLETFVTRISKKTLPKSKLIKIQKTKKNHDAVEPRGTVVASRT